MTLALAIGPAAAEPYEDGGSASAPSWYANTARTGWNTSANRDRVVDIAQIGDRIYVAGNFRGIRSRSSGAVSNRSYLVAFDKDSGEPIWSFKPRLDGPVHSLAVAGDGSRLYVGGAFRTAAGRPRRGLVALWPGGAIDGRWRADAVGGEVRAVVATNSSLYVGGEFDTVNGVDRVRLARIKRSNGAVDRAWNARAAGGTVVALEMPPRRGRLYVGGHFSSLNGADGTDQLGALRTDNGRVIRSFRQEPGRDVLDLMADGRGRLWAGLGGSGGRAQVYDRAGHVLRTWDTDGDVCAVERIGSRVYFGGHELVPGNQEIATVDYQNPNAWDTSTFRPNIGGGEVLAFHADGRNLWVGGMLSRPYRGIGRFSPR